MAPTTNAQAYAEPYDLGVDLEAGQSKPLFFESKGVAPKWDVNINVEQLLRLIAMSQMYNEMLWYVIPCIQHEDRRRIDAQQMHIRSIQNHIGNNSRVLTPLQIRDIFFLKGGIQIFRNWLGEIDGWRRGRRTYPWDKISIPMCDIQNYHLLTLEDFFKEVAACRIGRPYENRGEGSIMELMHNSARAIGRYMSFEEMVNALFTQSSTQDRRLGPLTDINLDRYQDWYQSLIELARQLDAEGISRRVPQNRASRIPMGSVVPV